MDSVMIIVNLKYKSTIKTDVNLWPISLAIRSKINKYFHKSKYLNSNN